MPDGVEHLVKGEYVPPSPYVILPLMPDGVEHQWQEARKAAERRCDPSSDARRR